MYKKIFILGGILIAGITLGCVTASASTITQNTYDSDNVYFPDGQYQMNYDFKIGIASSTSYDFNKVIYNSVIPRDIAEVNPYGSYTEEVYKYGYYEESADNLENVILLTYWDNVNASITGQEKFIDYSIETEDSFLLSGNNDFYFRFSDFFYMNNGYLGHSLRWTNATDYYNAWLESDFNIDDDLGFIDFTIFRIINGVVVPERRIEPIGIRLFMMDYFTNGNVNFDRCFIEYITQIEPSLYGFYINDCVVKFKDLFYYTQNLDFRVHYYHYDGDMFERLGDIDFTDEEFDVSDFLIDSIGGFMDFEIIPNFSFGLLLSFILTLAIIVWIIKVFMGG